MRPMVWASLLLSLLLAQGGAAMACEEYPGQPVPTITGTETNLEPCEPRPPFVPQVVVVRPVIDRAGVGEVTGSLAGSALQPRPGRAGCQVEQYNVSGAIVRVHRC
jgi:hypothetical protein